MKKHWIKILLIMMTLLLTGCSSAKHNTTTKGDALEVAAAIAASQTAMPQLTVVQQEDDYFSAYLNFYALDESLFEDAAIGYAGGVEASEIAVLEVKDQADTDTVRNALSAYIEHRADTFYGYVPDQAAIAENGIVEVNGNYVALIIAEDVNAAREAFYACFDEDWTAPDSEQIFILYADSSKDGTKEEDTAAATITCAPSDTPENGEKDENTGAGTDGSSSEGSNDTGSNDTDPSGDNVSDSDVADDESGNESDNESGDLTDDAMDEYDEASVLEAYISGDTSSLTALNLAVFNAAALAITQVITEDMSDREKEKAIHNYICRNGEYDPEEISHAQDAHPNPNNDNPYGMLIDGVGICKGYTYTFRLVMDLLGITCISVDGEAGPGNAHAWNMVQLEDVWYCVDVTWDDSNPNPYEFFNVTSQFMRDTNHQWDESNVPEAAGR